MAGKLVKGMENLTVDSENSKAPAVASAVSILPSQNGSPSGNQDGDLGISVPLPDNLSRENTPVVIAESDSDDEHNVVLDMIRDKLISEFSSEIFRSNLESELSKMDPMKIDSDRMSVIEDILVQISLLSDREKLLLYLKLPNSANSAVDPLTQPLNPLGKRQEIQQAIVWVKTHLEEDEDKSMPKQDVYDQYLKYCRNGSMKALSTADFGKVVKQLLPGIRPRRLGTRGNSRYCYSGMKNSVVLPPPCLPKSVDETNEPCSSTKNDNSSGATEEEKGKGENSQKKFKKQSKSIKTPSPVVVKESSPQVINLTIENEVTIHPDEEQNLPSNLNTGSENQGNLSQSPKHVDGSKYGLGAFWDIYFDDFLKLVRKGITESKINLHLPDKMDLLDKIDLLNDILDGKGSHQTAVDKSNEVNSNQNKKSAESESNKSKENKSQPNKTQPNNSPATEVASSNAPNTASKRSNNAKSSPLKERCSLRYQRLKSYRPCSLPESNSSRRTNYIPIRPKPVKGEKNLPDDDSDSVNGKASTSKKIKKGLSYFFDYLKERELLGEVGEAIVDKLLKLEKLTRNILNGKYKHIWGARCQRELENKIRRITIVRNAVLGEPPQRSRSSAESSAESTAALQTQGNTEFISNTESIVNINTIEFITQNNTATGNRSENVPMSTSANNWTFIPISPNPRTPAIGQETSPLLTSQSAQDMPNNDILPPNSGFLPPNTGVLPPNAGFLSPNTGVLPPNTGVLPTNTGVLPPNAGFLSPNTGVLSPNTGVLPPNTGVLPTNTGVLPPNNDFLPPNTGVLPPNTGVLPPNNDFLPPNTGVLPPNTGVLPPNNDFLPPNTGVLPPNTGVLPPNTGVLPPNTGVLPPNNDFLPPNTGVLPPNTGVLPPNTGVLPTNTGVLPPNNDFLPPNAGFLSPNTGVLPPNIGVLLPNTGVLPPNNDFVPPNNDFLLPNNDFVSPNSGLLLPTNNFQPSNNVVAPNNNFLFPNNTFLPQNNANLSTFNIINTGVLSGGFNVQNNIAPEVTCQKPMPDMRPKSNSANLFGFNTSQGSPEIFNFDQLLPNQTCFNQPMMEDPSKNENITYPNFSGEIDQIFVNQPNIECPEINVIRSQSEPIFSTTEGEFWFSNDNNDVNDDSTFDQYLEEPSDQMDTTEYCFEPVLDCEAMEPCIEDDHFPDLSLDDLILDSDDITDQVFSDNFSCNISFDDDSLNTFSGELENDVFESPIPTENMNSYFETAEEPLDQANALLYPEAGNVDLFDNLFPDSTEDSKDPMVENLTPLNMNELPMDDFAANESPSTGFFPFADNVENELNEYLGLN